MADGLLRSMGGDRFDAHSAGTKPTLVRPEAVLTMRELGIDISHHRSKPVEEFLADSFDYVITVCDSAKESCPVFPGKSKRIHWSLEDPAVAAGDEAARLAVFRRVRDELAARLNTFLSQE